jgi:hypothetical protein
MTSDDVGPVEQVPLSDWADQDLLTKDEAHERLLVEIDRTKAQLGKLAAGSANDAELTLLTRRLNAMESICEEYDAYLGEK